MGKLYRPTWRQVKKLAYANRDLLFFNGFLLFKITVVHLEIGVGIGSPLRGLASLALLFVLSGLVVLLPRAGRFVSLLLLDLLLTVLLLADLFFYRNYDRILPISMLHEAGQLGDVLDSLLSIFSLRDLLLFGDFLFLIPFLLMAGKERLVVSARWPWERRRLSRALLVGSAALLLVQGTVLALRFGKGAFQELYTNEALLRNMGILNYHAVDLFNYLRDPNTEKVTEAEVNLLKTWMDLHRKQQQQELFAAAKGKNLIIVQMEALQGFLIGRTVNGQEVTPNLNRLVNESLYFDNYFAQVGVGNTSDAEFMTFNSLYPLEGSAVYSLKADNHYRSLPILLKEQGYSSYVFHSYKQDFYNRANMYKAEGFDKFFSQYYFSQEDIIGWGPSDQVVYRQALDVIKRSSQPFLSFFITLSAHHTYKLPDAKKELVIPPHAYSELFTDYLHAQHYADRALGELIAKLKELGIMNNSLFVVYGDHFANGLDKKEIGRFMGTDREIDNYLYHEQKRVPLWLRLPSGAPAGIRHVSGGQMDLLPTLANLLGLEKAKMFYFGQDLLNVGAGDGFSAFRFYTQAGTYVTDRLFYIASQDGIFEHGACHDRSAGGALLPVQTCQPGWKRAKWEFQMSDLILRSDALPQIAGE